MKMEEETISGKLFSYCNQKFSSMTRDKNLRLEWRYITAGNMKDPERTRQVRTKYILLELIVIYEIQLK